MATDFDDDHSPCPMCGGAMTFGYAEGVYIDGRYIDDNFYDCLKCGVALREDDYEALVRLEGEANAKAK
jgi:tRNA(Arg) A34 adenosine deaminase TadA